MANIFRNRQHFLSFHIKEFYSYILVIGLYLTIALSILIIYLAEYNNLPFPFAFKTFSFVLIGWSQYSLGNAMHEAVHFNFLNKKKDFLASVITAYPIGFNLNYRDFHFKHHKYVGTKDDPEYEVYRNFPKSKLQFLGRLIWCGSGLPAIFQFIRMQLKNDKTQHKVLQPRRINVILDIFMLLIIQTFIASIFYFIFKNPFFYLFFWLMPIATIGKLLSSTRLLCEHGSPTKGWVIRTINGSRIYNYLLGAFDFNYHGEHHLYPTIPHSQLKRLHKTHVNYIKNSKKNYNPLNGKFEIFEGSYLELIIIWFKELPMLVKSPKK